ncbi:DUF4126 domain-containing protein [Streptomyces sp. NPDC059092]|uniref:DUF4126 domain-containing protein n=1 Tax=Streptomyces sp. NPDC059092 TaxID=3346725 RepID=UPI0036BF48AF
MSVLPLIFTSGWAGGVNASPERVSNVLVSTAEGLGVAGIVAFALFRPVAASVIAGPLLVAGVATVLFLATRIRGSPRRRARNRAVGGTG